MAKATVAHITKEELSDALAVEKQTSKPEMKVNIEPKENRRSLYSTEFIKKLKREEIEKFFAGTVFKTIIPRNVRLAEAPSFGEPICVYDPKCTGAIAYKALTEEFLKNNE